MAAILNSNMADMKVEFRVAQYLKMFAICQCTFVVNLVLVSQSAQLVRYKLPLYLAAGPCRQCSCLRRPCGPMAVMAYGMQYRHNNFVGRVGQLPHIRSGIGIPPTDVASSIGCHFRRFSPLTYLRVR